MDSCFGNRLASALRMCLRVFCQVENSCVQFLFPAHALLTTMPACSPCKLPFNAQVLRANASSHTRAPPPPARCAFCFLCRPKRFFERVACSICSQVSSPALPVELLPHIARALSRQACLPFSKASWHRLCARPQYGFPRCLKPGCLL